MTSATRHARLFLPAPSCGTSLQLQASEVQIHADVSEGNRYVTNPCPYLRGALVHE